MLVFFILSDVLMVDVFDWDWLVMVFELVQVSGVVGMCGGQVLDLQVEGQQVDLQVLECIYCYKMGVLICVVVWMGVLSVGECGCVVLFVLDCYVENIGFVFQVQDDIFDVVGDIVIFGKCQGVDQ